MHVIRASNYRMMPWKNGGGETTEIFVSPVTGNFDWRVSIAKVNSDGPFSTFSGYERHIMTLSGQGMTLDIEGRGVSELEPLKPFSFSGDLRVNGSLVDGPVLDFNLIVRRDFGQGTLRVMDCGAGYHFAPGRSLRLIHVLAGKSRIGDQSVSANDSFYLGAGEQVFLSVPLKLVICEITSRSKL
jgi:uncharacterized protein